MFWVFSVFSVFWLPKLYFTFFLTLLFLFCEFFEYRLYQLFFFNISIEEQQLQLTDWHKGTLGVSWGDPPFKKWHSISEYIRAEDMFLFLFKKVLNSSVNFFWSINAPVTFEITDENKQLSAKEILISHSYLIRQKFIQGNVMILKKNLTIKGHLILRIQSL